MPVYTYDCRSCDTQVELLRNVCDRGEPVICETCGVSCTRILSLGAPVQWKKPMSASNITGNPNEVVCSAKEAEALATKHGQIIVEPSDLKKVNVDEKANLKRIRKDLDRIAQSL